jgi:hypothetical protein
MKTKIITLLLTTLAVYNSNAQTEKPKDSIAEKIPFKGIDMTWQNGSIVCRLETRFI